MGVTTIKVSSDLRDRIAQGAAAEGLSAAQLIAQLLDERDRRARLDAVRAAHAAADPAYVAETQEWDGAVGDGLA